MIYRKITAGFVIQEFNDDGKPISQEFIAGDEVDYEDEDGEVIDVPENDTYLPFDMVQPDNDNSQVCKLCGKVGSNMHLHQDEWICEDCWDDRLYASS